ncbi:MAG: NAD-dependent epimerase/dehydratase family protein [Clostridiaceae bacterium]
MENLISSQITTKVYEDIKPIAEERLPWEKLKNSTVFITGAGGFISYYLVLALLIRNDLYKDNIKVVGLVRSRERAEKKYKKILERSDFKLVVQDVCSPFSMDEKADYIIHAASQASAWHYENDPVGTINANLTGTINVLEYARSCGAKATLMISSLKVYGAVHNGASSLTEDTVGYIDHTSYKNCYAQGKRAAETLCASYHKQYGMDVKISRPSYIYGPSSLTDDRVWAQFIANVVKNQSILLKSNGGAYRSFCYVRDTASALLYILLKGEAMVPYNIAAEHSNITIRGFAREAVKVFPEKNLTLSFANKEDEVEPDISLFSQTPEILDSKRLEALGWEAKVNLAEGIRTAALIVEEQNR